MNIDAAFTSFPEMATKRLRLRQLRPGDAEALFAIRSDSLVRASYGREPYQTLAESQAFIQVILGTYAQRDGLFWAITRDTDDTMIGSCCFWNFGDEFRGAEVGYELGRAHWGQGITTEAVAAIVAYGFSELDLHRIEANPHASNTASKRLLLTLGFTHEGTLRERAYFQGHFDDQEYYGLLAREWQMREARLQAPLYSLS